MADTDEKKNSPDLDQTGGTVEQKEEDALNKVLEGINELKDLFVRRLYDDKQKNAMIQQLTRESEFAFIEPFLTDIILVLDRLEQSSDDFIVSVYEELYGILNRRGVEKIQVGDTFDPLLYKAVKRIENPDLNAIQVKSVIRNGYTLSGRVIRPAEVAVECPKRN